MFLWSNVTTTNYSALHLSQCGDDAGADFAGSVQVTPILTTTVQEWEDAK